MNTGNTGVRSFIITFAMEMGIRKDKWGQARIKFVNSSEMFRHPSTSTQNESPIFTTFSKQKYPKTPADIGIKGARLAFLRENQPSTKDKWGHPLAR
jgi:hypothetical protein